MKREEIIKRKITMEELRRLDENEYASYEDGLEYLDEMLDTIKDLTITRNELYNKYLTIRNTTVGVCLYSTIQKCYEDRSELLVKLGSKYLLANLDDELRNYINDRLKGIVEESIK